MLDCDFTRARYEALDVIEMLQQLESLLPGLCLVRPYEAAGYPADDPNEKRARQFNVVTGDPDRFTVSISKLQSNYQAAPPSKTGEKKGNCEGDKGKGKGKGKGGKGKGKGKGRL